MIFTLATAQPLPLPLVGVLTGVAEVEVVVEVELALGAEDAALVVGPAGLVDAGAWAGFPPHAATVRIIVPATSASGSTACEEYEDKVGLLGQM